tara:strand:- start:8951 stop:9142 length:192 start_codon:yes stop_codon:yes gene_type:complete
MKISRKRLVEIIKEELEASADTDATVEDLVYELEYLLGRTPTPEEVERIRKAVLAGALPERYR